jgi:two-component system sensor histidine kinase KdpD
MDDYRPDPDALLAAVQKEESRQQRGKLKIFFGMAAGVGKTYSMLDAARHRKAEGIDVVIGYVETHKRAETEALVGGLELIPRKKIPYRDATIEEMDIDAILARSPQLVLVDELPHTNAPTSRHAKRWQDILELLEAGIDVYTTVNVQHFESRADAVRQITGITVHETVPDSILDFADDIELVDLSPEDLRKRLQEGKVYTSERIETASNNFFRVGNLTALREMALRLTAEHVDHQLQDYMQVKRIAGPWKSGERLMVAISPSPFSEQLIRWTRRMAYNLEAPWLALYVQTTQPLALEAKERLAQNLSLARNLGGEIVTTNSDDITDAIIRFARQRNVTQIVVGKPLQSWFRELLKGGSLVDKIIRASGDIDIYVVTGDKPTEPKSSFTLNQPVAHSTLWQYVLAISIIVVITIFDLILVSALTWFSYEAVGLIELFAVLLIAVYIGRGPALFAATVSAISWNFLFIEPRLTFDISRSQDIILFVLYFVIAIFTGNLTARIRTQEKQAKYNVERTMALYDLAHETARAMNMDDVIRIAVAQIQRVFDAQVTVILPVGSQLSPSPHPVSTLAIDEKEYSVARWSFEHSKPAGRFTDTLTLANAQYIPLLTPTRTVGVVGIRTRQNERLSFDQELLLETFINQVSMVVERELLDEAAEQSAMLQESERLYTTLLNSISHELRTPITTIAGAASSLHDSATLENATTRRELVSDIQIAAERLNRLVANLLDISRLESGRLNIKRDWCDIGEIVGVAVQRLKMPLSQHPLTMTIAPDVPLIKADFVLIEQVIVNLLDNACAYTPKNAPIRLEAVVKNRAIDIIISDSGQGIPPDDLERIFDKFYRVPGTATGGTGLGLSICRGLIEAHGGTLTAQNQLQAGAQFIIRLPLNGTPPPVIEAKMTDMKEANA